MEYIVQRKLAMAAFWKNGILDLIRSSEEIAQMSQFIGSRKSTNSLPNPAVPPTATGREPGILDSSSGRRPTAAVQDNEGRRSQEMDDLMESRRGGQPEADYASTSATTVPLPSPPAYVAALLDPAAFADQNEPFTRKINEISRKYLALFAEARRIEDPDDRQMQLEALQQDKSSELEAVLNSQKAYHNMAMETLSKWTSTVTTIASTHSVSRISSASPQGSANTTSSTESLTQIEKKKEKARKLFEIYFSDDVLEDVREFLIADDFRGAWQRLEDFYLPQTEDFVMSLDGFLYSYMIKKNQTFRNYVWVLETIFEACDLVLRRPHDVQRKYKILCHGLSSR